MEQPHRSSHLRQGPDLSGSSVRIDERRAAVAQMMAENREGLGMKIIAVMVQRYGVLPRELWDLNSISDMGAGRGITYDDKKVSKATLKSLASNNRYSIIKLTISEGVSHNVELPNTLRQLIINARKYDFPLDLPANLYELTFGLYCQYNQPLVLPAKLGILQLAWFYDHPLTLPSTIVDLELGRAFNHPLILPQQLEWLGFDMDSPYNQPLALPPSLAGIYFNDRYNQPVILPPLIKDLRIGSEFTHDLTFPLSLRSLEWCCNRPIQIPGGVSDVAFGFGFNQPAVIPTHVRKLAFHTHEYFHPLNFPAALQKLRWEVEEHNELVLPEGLRKLTWASKHPVELPLGLRHLVIESSAPLILPAGLLKVTIGSMSRGHYTLPESVREVTWSAHPKEESFTHPTTLQHLIMAHKKYGEGVDLSRHSIFKLTIGGEGIRIKNWPQGLEELAFTVDEMEYPLRVPQGCTIVGEKRPTNVITE